MSRVAALRAPVQSRSQRTRAALVKAARREFSTVGYALTTAKSIAERARVGTGTFYHYFPDKDAVLCEIASERVRSLLEETAPLSFDRAANDADSVELDRAAMQRLEKLVELYVRYHRADRGLHAVITERRLCDPRIDEIMQASEQEAVLRIQQTIARLGYEHDSEAAAYMMFSLLEGAVHAHVLGKPTLSEERFTLGLVEALLRIGMPRAPEAHGARS